jgi:hypothetical protein
MKKKPSEDRIQSDFVVWLWNSFPKIRRCWYHIPNGGLRSAKEAVKLRAMGVVPGIPDIHIAIPGNGYNSLYIEFKEPDANNNTDHYRNQLKVHECLKAVGNNVVICISEEEAKTALYNHLKNTDYLLSE